MQFEIQGFDRVSGEARRERVKCDSEDIARQYAEKRGIIVDTIQPVASSSSSGARPQPAPVAAPSPVAAGYQPPSLGYSSGNDAIPEYKALRLAAQVLTGLSYVGYIIAAVLLILALYFFFTTRIGFRSPLDAVASFMPAVSMLMLSVFNHAFGQGFLALRDIARNSFRG